MESINELNFFTGLNAMGIERYPHSALYGQQMAPGELEDIRNIGSTLSEKTELVMGLSLPEAGRLTNDRSITE